MYLTLLILHNIIRWIVLVSLIFAIYRSARGLLYQYQFSKVDNAIRHWTATFAHIQLMIGMVLYFQSPTIKYFWSSSNEEVKNSDNLFFGVIHALLMLLAIVIVTIGSAKSKRKHTGKEKYKTMFVWFLIALVIIFIAIPWPFSPLANRPYIR